MSSALTTPEGAAGRWLSRFRERPLDALFSTLATAQPDRALEPFWMRLCRLEGQTPTERGRAALAGLRLLPSADPARPGLAPSLFGGLVDFAEALARRGAGPDDLFDEIAYLCALQSLTPAVLGRLNRLVSDHRQYYQRTGDGFYLVRCFERLSNAVRALDTGLARDLAHEALRAEPSNHNNWAALGRAIDEAGDWTRARAVVWHARRRFPHNPFAHTQLGQALLRHGEDAAALAACAEAARRFPNNPVAVQGHGHALLELEGPDAALPVLRAGVDAHRSGLPLRNDYTDALIQAGALAEAERQLEAARRIDSGSGRRDTKVEKLAHLLDLAKSGQLGQRHRQEPAAGPAGDPNTLSDIAGSGLAHAPALGESTLFRQVGEPDRAGGAIERLPAGAERDAEQGLWLAAREGWGAAVAWWRGRETYEAVTRIHALRSLQRSGEGVDWEPLSRDLPQYSPVIRLLRGRDVPLLQVTEKDPEDLKRNAWLHREATFDMRRDNAEEDWLAAAQVI